MDADSAVSVVNIVSSGKVDVELDLAAVAEDLRQFDYLVDVEHSRRQGNRLLIEFQDNESLGILAPTGVYVFTGADTHKEVEEARVYLMKALSELGIISSPEPPPDEIVDTFEVKNLVSTVEVDYEVDLDALAIGLGLENTEYEPEQFPGLVFRPSSESCTLLVFASGKIVVTGVRDIEVAEREFGNLKEKMGELLSTN
jgi:transcription initiation factor TFIID TATA-box-binding protein